MSIWIFNNGTNINANYYAIGNPTGSPTLQLTPTCYFLVVDVEDGLDCALYTSEEIHYMESNFQAQHIIHGHKEQHPQFIMMQYLQGAYFKVAQVNIHHIQMTFN